MSYRQNYRSTPHFAAEIASIMCRVAENSVPRHIRRAGDCATVRPTAGNNLAGRTQEAKFRLPVTGDASYSKILRFGTHLAGRGLRHRGAYVEKLPCWTHPDSLRRCRVSYQVSCEMSALNEPQASLVSVTSSNEGGSRHPDKTHEQRSKLRRMRKARAVILRRHTNSAAR